MNENLRRENERQFREQSRQIELDLIKARKARQTQCYHAKGGGLVFSSSRNNAFCFLKLPTGEVVGACLYCQKKISSIDPRDREIFTDALAKCKTTIPESGQYLDHLDATDKLFKQLTRFTPEEKEEIIKGVIRDLKGKPVSLPPQTPKSQSTEEYLRSLPDDELEKIAKQEYAEFRRKYR